MSIALLAKAEWDHTAWEAPRAVLLTQDVPMHMFQIWKEIMLVNTRHKQTNGHWADCPSAVARPKGPHGCCC